MGLKAYFETFLLTKKVLLEKKPNTKKIFIHEYRSPIPLKNHTVAIVQSKNSRILSEVVIFIQKRVIKDEIHKLSKYQYGEKLFSTVTMLAGTFLSSEPIIILTKTSIARIAPIQNMDIVIEKFSFLEKHAHLTNFFYITHQIQT